MGTGRHRLTIACSGTFSTVARATRKSDGQQVAVKAIDKQLIDDSMDVNIEILVRGGRRAIGQILTTGAINRL